jgi:hypothetical protein
VEHLDVPAFVDDLRRSVELAVEELHGLGHLRSSKERTLLAV